MNRNEEAILREYVRANLRSDRRLDEGVLDAALKKAIDSVLPKLESIITKLKKYSDASDELIDIIVDNGGAESVQKVNTVGKQFVQSIKTVDSAVPAATKESTAYVRYQRFQREQVILETRIKRHHLNESLAVGAVLMMAFNAMGIIFGIVGAIPLLLKLVAKILGWTGFKKQSEAILKGPYEKMHHMEEGFIDWMVPDKAVYAVYKKLNESEKDLMPMKEFVKSKQKKVYEKRMWAVILIPWLINGLTHLHHTFHSLFNVAETGATTVKAVETGSAAAEIGSSVASAVDFTGAAGEITKDAAEVASIIAGIA